MPYKDSAEDVYRKRLLKDVLSEDPGPVELGIRKFVHQIEVTDPKKLALAEMAYSLARVLDYDASNSSAGLSKELRELLEAIGDGTRDPNEFFDGLNRPV